MLQSNDPFKLYMHLVHCLPFISLTLHMYMYMHTNCIIQNNSGYIHLLVGIIVRGHLS